jgi:2'-5' RNA ligase
MAFSIELNFDADSSLIVKNMWKKLRERDISDYMDKFGEYPHISLAIIDDINIPEVEGIIEKLIRDQSMFNIRMSNLGSFPSDEGVLFISPDTSDTLVNFHKKLHRYMENIKAQSKYYLPEFWHPHCTLGMNIAKSKMPEAFEVVKEDFKPFDVKIETIKLIEFDPVKVIKSFSFLDVV